MVCPSALAETVTPPIGSPDADLIVPLSTTSAAAALHGRRAARPSANRLANAKHRRFVMASLLVAGLALRRRHGLEVGDDGVDLGAVEMMLESRHARGA